MDHEAPSGGVLHRVDLLLREVRGVGGADHLADQRVVEVFEYGHDVAEAPVTGELRDLLVRLVVPDERVQCRGETVRGVRRDSGGVRVDDTEEVDRLAVLLEHPRDGVRQCAAGRVTEQPVRAFRLHLPEEIEIVAAQRVVVEADRQGRLGVRELHPDHAVPVIEQSGERGVAPGQPDDRVETEDRGTVAAGEVDQNALPGELGAGRGFRVPDARRRRGDGLRGPVRQDRVDPDVKTCPTQAPQELHRGKGMPPAGEEIVAGSDFSSGEGAHVPGDELRRLGVIRHSNGIPGHGGGLLGEVREGESWGTGAGIFRTGRGRAGPARGGRVFRLR